MAAFNVGDLVAHIKADVSDFKKGIGQAKEGTESMTAAVFKANIATEAFKKAVGFAVEEVKSFISSSAQFEQSQIAFTTMLGSAEEANKLLADLAQFAKKTPFEVVGIETSAKQLLAMGIETEKLLPTLKALGDVSAGLSVDLNRVAYNFGQVKAQGQLTGVELKDFARAGVPVIAELAKNLEVSESAIKEMVAAGEISFADVEQAFITMSGEGGKFFDLMEAQSSTFNGQVANIRDAVELLKREIGAELLPTAKMFTAWIIETAIPATKEFITWLLEHKELILATAIGITAMLVPAFFAWAAAAIPAAAATIAATLPILALGAAVTAVAYLIIKNWDNIKAAATALKDWVVSTFSTMADKVREIGGRILSAIMWPFEEAKRRVQDAVNFIKDHLDFTQRHSPSVLDVVKSGVKLVNNALEDLPAQIDVAPMVGLTGMAAAAGATTNSNTIQISLDGAIIADQAGARRMAEMMGNQLVSKLKKNVRF